MTKKQMLDAIKAYFGDRSRSAEETKDGLQEARDEIDMLIDSIEEN